MQLVYGGRVQLDHLVKLGGKKKRKKKKGCRRTSHTRSQTDSFITWPHCGCSDLINSHIFPICKQCLQTRLLSSWTALTCPSDWPFSGSLWLSLCVAWQVSTASLSALLWACQKKKRNFLPYFIHKLLIIIKHTPPLCQSFKSLTIDKAIPWKKTLATPERGKYIIPVTVWHWSDGVGGIFWRTVEWVLVSRSSPLVGSGWG